MLCVDALKAAVNEARKGRDTEAYREAVELLHLVAPHEPEAALDTTWIANTNRTNKAEAARLEAELKGYKNNLIKESIRVRPTYRAGGAVLWRISASNEMLTREAGSGSRWGMKT